MRSTIPENADDRKLKLNAGSSIVMGFLDTTSKSVFTYAFKTENPSCCSYKRENYGNNVYQFGVKVESICNALSIYKMEILPFLSQMTLCNRNPPTKLFSPVPKYGDDFTPRLIHICKDRKPFATESSLRNTTQQIPFACQPPQRTAAQTQNWQEK
ncbi:hypothetical protein E5288_WYG021320 [Bos mutus]|uniref:Uncharacterized protein n=1 Tax=Bos mutus TaxID=72004 RepID=A0A6B0RDU6_9CETA|nr:hypothetical protein [Bos mutus]